MYENKNINSKYKKYKKYKSYEVFSEEETQNIAYNIAKSSNKNNIYCLSGELGTGKTSFSKGFAKGLGILEDVTSPTFNIVNEYRNCPIPFFHFDVYRICDENELYDIGYEEYFFAEGICLVEWAEIVKGLIPKNAIWITISKDLSKGDDFRLIEINKI